MKHLQARFLISEKHSLLLKRENNAYKTIFESNRKGEWKESALIPLITLEENQPVWATELHLNDSENGQINLLLETRKEKNYIISTEIKTSPNFHPWLHFRTTINFEKDYTFNEMGPEVKLDLGLKDYRLENMVSIRQPTRHTPSTDEWKSNDMPATAIWNFKTRLQSFFFMNFSEMEWMSPQTIERFSIYECGIQSDGLIGLVHRIPLKSPVTFSKGTVLNFDFFFLQEFREEHPTQWDLVEDLTKHCFKLVPSYVPFAREGLNWTDFSEGCIDDLMKENLCWVDPKSPKYFAYVMDDSELKRREAIGRSNIFETMTLLSLLPPWILYSQIHQKTEIINHLKLMYKTLEHFIDQESDYFYNNIKFNPNESHEIIKATEYSIGDSWYFFEPILRLGWVIRLAPLLDLGQNYYRTFKNMVKMSTEFVTKHNYEITAFYDPFTQKPLHEVLDKDGEREELLKLSRGKEDIIWKKKAKNFACLGIHLYIVVEAYYLFQEKHYLEEAIKSAKKLASFSPDMLFWEPFEIAYAVSGFTDLTKITNDNTYLEVAKRFLLNELRMFYWYEDNSFNWKGKRSNLGLPMACIGIRYPAVKENVESVLPWLMYLKTAMNIKGIMIPEGILKFLNLVRINTFYFFSDVLPKEFIYPPRRNTPCPYIPFEDLEMLETAPHFSVSQEYVEKGSRTGILGREIYGAGEIIYLYLMFEALAKCNVSDIMILNLDLFDFSLLKEFPPKILNFVLYNPLEESTKCQVVFYTCETEMYKMKLYSLQSAKVAQNLTLSKKELDNGIEFVLDKEEVLNVTLTPIE